MEVKKTSRSDLEKERSTFLLLGLVVALSVFFVVLEWQSVDTFQLSEEELNHLFIEEEFESLGLEKLAPLPEPIVVELHPPVVFEDFNPVKETEESTQPEVNSLPEVSGQEELKEPHPESVDKNESKNDVVTEAEVAPEFPGGYEAMIRYIYQQVKYPSAAMKQRIQGKVLCSFIINRDGTISDIVLEKGIYIYLDEEALRVIQSMPVWKPGLIKGKPVRFKYYLPLVFRL